jgi:hypothetical protein
MTEIDKTEYEKLLIERGKAAKKVLVQKMKLRQALNGLAQMNKVIDKLKVK